MLIRTNIIKDNVRPLQAILLGVILFLAGLLPLFPESENPIAEILEREILRQYGSDVLNDPKYEYNVTLRLISPNGSEIFHPGDTLLITWESQSPLEEVKSVKLEYSTDNGYSYRTIINYFSNTGRYEWEIPHYAALSSRCLVRVCRADGMKPPGFAMLYHFRFRIPGTSTQPKSLPKDKDAAFTLWLGNGRNTGGWDIAPNVSFFCDKSPGSYIVFNDIFKSIPELGKGWHSLKVLMHQDTHLAWLWLDGKEVFEKVTLHRDFFCRPSISFSAESGTGGVEIDDLTIRALNPLDKHKRLSLIFKEDFEGFPRGSLKSDSGWRITGRDPRLKVYNISEAQEIFITAEDYLGSTKFLELKGFEGDEVFLVRDIDMPNGFPFDISDKPFEIRYNENMNTDVRATEPVERGHGPNSVTANTSRTQSGELINTYYIYSYDGKLMEEYDHSGNCVKQYIYFGNRLFAEYHPQTDKYYYHTIDQVNSTRIITDDNGNVVYSEVFGPYGDIQKTWAKAYDPKLKFSGKERETYSGLDYFGARYFDHNSYRFISVDPIINRKEAFFNPQLWNLYSYCRNNPVTYLDPDGRQDFDHLADALAAQYLDRNTDISYREYFQTTDIGRGFGALAGIAGLTGYFAPEAIATLPIFQKAIQQYYRLARILKGKYKKALDYALDPIKMKHIFRSKHNLDVLVQKLGTKENVIKEVVLNLGKLPKSGVFEVTRTIKGIDVVIKGKVIDKVPRIGTIFIR